jgi:hypothetical protein
MRAALTFEFFSGHRSECHVSEQSKLFAGLNFDASAAVFSLRSVLVSSFTRASFPSLMVPCLTSLNIQ